MAELLDKNKVVAGTRKKLRLQESGSNEVSLSLSNLGKVRLWDVDDPYLYKIAVTLLSPSGKALHSYRFKMGIREAKFELDGFYLNGRRLQIFGLNRHEIYPYSGFAMPSRVMRRDAEILKNEYNCNMVRCSHYPQTESFLEACDELGLLVWEEVPGWGYLGDEAWKQLHLENVHDMIIRDRNHPSIVIWGDRVNESQNDVELYRKSRAIAKSLDDSRPTSGSMTSGSIKTWQTMWHEDVFAYDDYHATDDNKVGIIDPVPGFPFMLAEAVGQYNYSNPKEGFNAKYRRGADVEIQEAQALRHAEAHSKSASNKRNSGVIAWCAFDYSSLVNSYDNIKYPGIADVFRIPKLGASFYQTQVSPEKRPLIKADFYWDFGEKTPGGPGKNAAIFSNCDHLEVFINGKKHSTLYPDKINYPNIKYPPFFADLELDGSGNPELRIDGYVGGKLLVSQSYSSDKSKDKFILMPDDKELMGDGIDATRLVFMVTDKFGNPRLYAGGKVDFKISGPGEIVGDNPFNLTESGGAAAVWVKTAMNGRGKVSITANHSGLGSKTVEINVKPSHVN